MSDAFVVGLKTFPEDPDINLLRNALLGINGSLSVSNEIGGGIMGLLSLLTVIGTSLSIVGVVLAFITYSLFSDLRTVSGTSLLNLLAALFLAHLILVVGVEKKKDENLCLAIGFLLHYMWFSVQSWLTVMFRDMYITFKDNINLQPSIAAEQNKSFIKYAAFAWGVPAFLIIIAAAIHFKTEVDKYELVMQTCWIIGKGSLIFTFVFPAAVLMVMNSIYFVKSIIVIRYILNIQVTQKSRNKMKRRRYLQLFLYAKIAVVLTVTWTCCLIAELALSVIFWTAFTILISLQGFVVSLAYCCNSRVFRLYTKSFKASTHRSNYGAAELSRSTSLALLTWEPTPDAV